MSEHEIFIFDSGRERVRYRFPWICGSCDTDIAAGVWHECPTPGLPAEAHDLLAACKATEYADSLLSEWRARWQCTHSAEGVAAWNKWQMFDARARELRRAAIRKAEGEG